MNNFLAAHGWSVTGLVGEDGSPRRYSRVEKGGDTAIFMETFGEAPGHKISDFICIGAWLNEIGLKTPEVYELDEAGGLALLEDFGDVSFKDRPDYELAAQVLDHLSAQECPLDLPNYYDSHVHKAHRRVIDWYAPALRGERNPDGLVEAYLAVWQGIESTLPPCPQGFLHIDFHVENLMWLPGGSGLKRCGILDFQGAMIGPEPYDLGNLLEDMRTDVPDDVRRSLLAGKDENYLRWYRALTTQFHCRIIGQIIRWAVKEEKPGYLQYLPRVAGYLRSALEDPLLAPLKRFFSEEMIDFTTVKDLNIEHIKEHIRSDAV